MLDILRQPHSCCHSWRMLKVQHRTGGRPLAKGCVCMPVGLSGDGIKLAHLHFLVNQQTPGMFRWRDNHFFSTWPLLVYKCRSHQFNSKSSLFGGNPMIKKKRRCSSGIDIIDIKQESQCQYFATRVSISNGTWRINVGSLPWLLVHPKIA